MLFITLIFAFFISRGQDAVNLYSNAKGFGLTSSGYIWVASSEAAQGIALENAPQGETLILPKFYNRNRERYRLGNNHNVQ